MDNRVLEPYVYVDDNGHFQLDENGALAAGISLKVIELQKNASIEYNRMSDQGKIEIHEDLSIEKSRPSIQTFGYLGGNHWVDYHWWGVSHYFSTDQAAYGFARQLENVGSVYAGLGIIGALVSPAFLIAEVGAWYCDNMASSINYNAARPGNGVTLDINFSMGYRCYPN